jgi:hypothetical protein
LGTTLIEYLYVQDVAFGLASNEDADDKQLRQLESQLRDKLYEVVNSIKQVIKFDPLTSILLYTDEVDAMVRRYTEDAFIIGIDHAVNSLKHEGFLTHEDIDTIKQITDEHIQRFWARVEKGIIIKERQYKALQFTDKQDVTGHLSNAWLVDSIASSVIFTAYNSAVKTKAQKITT